MLVVIYNCPFFVKVGGWSFTLLPGRHTKFGLNQLKTEKVSPQHILLLGAMSRPIHPVKVALLKSLPHCPLSPPPAKKIKIVGFCPNLLGNRPWPLYRPGISLERDDMKLILNLWWTDNFNKSHNAHVPYHTIHHWEKNVCIFVLNIIRCGIWETCSVRFVKLFNCHRTKSNVIVLWHHRV